MAWLILFTASTAANASRLPTQTCMVYHLALCTINYLDLLPVQGANALVLAQGRDVGTCSRHLQLEVARDCPEAIKQRRSTLNLRTFQPMGLANNTARVPFEPPRK